MIWPGIPLLACALAAASTAVGQVYVDAGVTGGKNDGSSWANAYRDLGTALAGTASGDIWVAEGVYHPPGAGRQASFQLRNGVNLYGGFRSGANGLAERDWKVRRTILSGDIGTAGTAADNCCHVVVGADNSVLDGFVISHGYADQPGEGSLGGGMYVNRVSPTVRNCTFSDNYAVMGGGLSIDSASPTVERCRFDANSNLYGGGAILVRGAAAAALIRDCIFSRNKGGSGGAVSHNAKAVPVYESCVFTANTGNNGGAAANSGAAPIFRKCVFRANGALYSGGAAWNTNCPPGLIFDGCIFADSRAASGVIWNDKASPLLTGCLFVRNGGMNSPQRGCLVNGPDSSPVIRDCRFIDNLAYNAACVESTGGAALIEGCVFSGNRSGVSALCFHGGAPRMVNTVLVGNWSSWSGGAVWNDSGAECTVINCTFSGNRGNFGGAVGNKASSVSILNSILWNNQAQSFGHEIYNDSKSTARIAFCDIRRGWDGPELFNQESETASGRVIDGGGNIKLLPRFVDTIVGSWSGSGAYDSERMQTVLRDDRAGWKPGELAGRFVNPDVSQALYFPVAGNAVDTVTVWGDATGGAAGKSYRVIDVRLQSRSGRWTSGGWVQDSEHSPCIDAGDPQSAWDKEPKPNGRRINMGAEGNTPHASKSQ